ncbi:MAG: TIGR03013 family XrtA/PEP-CTERM system glycosyltransferase [Pseudomonadota bacterium]
MVRVFRHYIPKSLIVLGTGEALLLFGSVYLGVFLGFSAFNPTTKLLVGDIWSKAAVYTLVMMMMMAGMGLYQRGLRDDVRGLIFRISAAFLCGLAVMIAVLTIAPAMWFGGRAFSLAFVSSALCIVGFRVLVYRFAGGDLFRRRVAVLGVGALASQAQQLRRKTDRRDMELVGYVDIDSPAPQVVNEKHLSKTGTLLELARANKINDYVVAVDDAPDTALLNEILDCKMSGVEIVEMSTFIERQTGKIQLDAMNPGSFVFSDGFIQAVVKGYVIRVFDIALSLVGLLVAWPVMAITAFFVSLESDFKDPILYRQTRVGRNGTLFEILKFRSMRTDAEKAGAQFAAENDDRVTRVGRVIRKIRVDELPQLFNVLRGDMSFVGPRPERPEFVEELKKKIPFFELRLRVKPGITGWAQICYPYGSTDRDAKEKLQYDLYYIKNYSLFLDVMILIQTAQVVLWGKGAR